MKITLGDNIGANLRVGDLISFPVHDNRPLVEEVIFIFQRA